MSPPPKRDRAGVIAPPPLIFLAFFLVGWWMRRLLPRPESIVGGAVVMLLAVALIAWGAVTLKRARTTIDPFQPTTALVTTGPFRFSRNPLYLAMTLGYIATSLWTASLTSLLFLPLTLVALHYGVIAREERYLETKFGDAYRDYRRRVRRWV